MAGVMGARRFKEGVGRMYEHRSYKVARMLQVTVLAVTGIAGCIFGPEDPEWSVSPTSMDFGSVTVGSYEDKSFTIKNTGGGTLLGNAYVASGQFEIISGGGSFSLKEGENLRVTLRFEPTSGGRYTCTVSTGSSDHSVSCVGLGRLEPSCDVTPHSLDFGDVEVGDDKDKSFTIENVGGGTLTGSVTESCSHYRIVSGGGWYSLGAGESRTVTVRFSPTSTGTKTCTISTGSSCTNVNCSGTGTLGMETVYIRLYWSSGNTYYETNHPYFQGHVSFSHGGVGSPWSNECGLHGRFIYLDQGLLWAAYFWPHDPDDDGVWVSSRTDRIEVEWTAGSRTGHGALVGYIHVDECDSRPWGGYYSCRSYAYADGCFPHGSTKLEVVISGGGVSGDAAIKEVVYRFIGWEVQGSAPIRTGQIIAGAENDEHTDAGLLRKDQPRQELVQ